ncbi:efflux RND transporter periplasmic adaptor subunit [Sphingobium sp. AP49]|uniref:efflux RND transporter periplasmic adaptor subunit n=1 Tax=Sphingobium sp. AP49 TaxID=1144307 RepID=UPI00026ED0EF|nr:efflux RND transporter periplasmic adaptor subunit [Sphingobium sp. AP49]WHO37769.1 efflux RND transporter periplasmic adaptor subunit [Sphingobium sp. AP49]
MRKALIGTAGALVLLMVALVAWRTVRNSAPPPAAPPPLPVAAQGIDYRSVPDELQAVGSLRGVRAVTLAAETAGRVTAIRFEAGSHVQQGTPIVMLFDAPERADLAAAEARAAFARIQLQRSKELSPSGAEPRELLQQRQAEYDQAQAAVRQIEARLIQKAVRAPFAGETGIRQVNLGQYLNPGDAIATLTALDKLYVDFTLPQSDLAKLNVGATVAVTSDAWPDRQFSAHITAIEPIVGSDTRNVSVQATLANPDHALRPGMYVTAHVLLPSRTAIIVPATAIQTSASGGTAVVVRGPNARREGKAQFVPVQLGRRIGDDVIVEQGLTPGDVVVTAGQLRIQPDATVRVSPPPAPTPR